jgi:hypothetical protein
MSADDNEAAGENQPSNSADSLQELVAWLRTGNLDRDGIPLSKGDVRGSILRIMHDVGRAWSANVERTTLKQRRADLEDLRKTAKLLARLLHGEHDLLRLVAAGSGFLEQFIDPPNPGIAMSISFGPARSPAELLSGIPTDVPPTPARVRYQMVRPAIVLSRPLHTLIDAIKENQAALASTKPTGRHSFSEHFLGVPHRILVQGCLTLALRCRGEAALKARVRGDPPEVVYELASRIWTLCTEKPPEKKLASWVKNEVAAFRKNRAKNRQPHGCK